VTKSALEVYVVHDNALYKLTTFTFIFVLFPYQGTIWLRYRFQLSYSYFQRLSLSNIL